MGVEPQPQHAAHRDLNTTATTPVSFHWLDEFVGVTLQQKPDAAFDAPAVFVGHGIVAPEYQWDDYKGVDVRGKVVVLFTNEPPSDDPNFFTGRALTYYGRWTYKYRGSGAPRRRRGHHHSHHADGQLRMGRGALLLGPRGSAGAARAGRARRWPLPDG